ncbi:MAG: hypothetical protein ACOYB1_08920 [Limnohabitans sp.]
MIKKFDAFDQYKLPIAALCFLILVGLNLFLIQGSVFIDALAWICTVSLVGAILGLTSSRMAHSYLLFIVLGSLVFGVGPYESAAVLLWLASSWSLGVLVLGRLHANQRLASISATEAILVGAAIWLAIWVGMLHFAVNYQSLHIILCLFPCLLLANRYSVIRNQVFTGVVAVQDWVRSIPFWAWVVGIAVIGWVLRWASFPSMGYDDHALHLRVWTELLTQHRYSFDVSTQVWSVAPITVDALHAGLSLMAGSDARSAMNLGLAILLLLPMAGIFRTWKLPPRTQWLLMVLMASTPMLGWLLLSLQTELMLAVIALAGMRLVIDAHGGWRGQHVLGVLSCVALCASIKLPGAILGITILCSLAVRWWSQRKATPISGQMLRWPALLLLFPLSFLALHSYALAWKLTGNPVFPLYNAIFLSPYFDFINFSNPAYIHDFSFSSYFRIFFRTSEFNESGDYTAGWQYLVMLPIAMLTLLRSGAPSGLRIILIPLFCFGLLTFSAIQYWRYLFPVMPLAVIFIGSLFIQPKTAIRTTAFILALACIAANLFFFNRVSWIMNSPAGLAFNRDGKETLISLYAPASFLTERVNQLAPGSRVLYTSSTPYGATLHGVPLYTNWYQPLRDKAFRSLKDFDGLRDFLSKEKADFAILAMSVNSNLPDALLREYMSKYGYVEGQSNNFLLYRISDEPVMYQKIFELQESEEKPLGKIDFLLPVTVQGVTASTDGKVLAAIPTHRAKQTRYKVEFTCPSNSGYFVAQINWDKGAPYYRLIACDEKGVTFAEAIPIPIGANQGSIYVTSRETSSIQVKNITVEVN